jgi:hypothetical protein
MQKKAIGSLLSWTTLASFTVCCLFSSGCSEEEKDNHDYLASFEHRVILSPKVLIIGGKSTVKSTATVYVSNKETPANRWEIEGSLPPVKYVKSITLTPTSGSSSTTVNVVAADEIPNDSPVFVDSGVSAGSIAVAATAPFGTGTIRPMNVLTLEFSPARLDASDIYFADGKDPVVSNPQGVCTVKVSNDPSGESYTFSGSATLEYSSLTGPTHNEGIILYMPDPPNVNVEPAGDGKSATITFSQSFNRLSADGKVLRDPIAFHSTIAARSKSREIKIKVDIRALEWLVK